MPVLVWPAQTLSGRTCQNISFFAVHGKYEVTISFVLFELQTPPNAIDSFIAKRPVQQQEKQRAWCGDWLFCLVYKANIFIVRKCSRNNSGTQTQNFGAKAGLLQGGNVSLCVSLCGI